ncbi:MAG: hypothetical protein ACRC1J_07910 [Sandaracinobacteroides sp.]
MDLKLAAGARVAALALAMICSGPAAVLAQARPAPSVGVVVVRPMPSAQAEQWVQSKPSRTACIDVSRIAGAMVVDQRSVDVVMRGGKRWRLTLAQQCPQLSYYGGFYYQPSQAGKFCAGQDRIISRAGGACRVSHIGQLRQVQPRR